MIEQEAIIKPIKRYECTNCEYITDISIDKTLINPKCCSLPNFKLILFEDDGSFKIKMGECYENIQAVLKTYMDMPEDKVKLISLWILGTYFHDSFNTYPYLFINAMRGSGKTRLLKLISHLSFNGKGKVYSGIKETLLFRTPKHHTLVFDELESIGSTEKASLREYLNASYKKGATVSRAKKVKSKDEENFVLEEFEPYKPIAMANIWGMDDVLGDRCLTIILEKSNNPLKTKLQEDFDINPKISNIKRTLNQFSDVCDVTLSKKVSISDWNNFIILKYDVQTTTSYISLSSLSSLSSSLSNNINNEKLDQEEFFNAIDGSDINGRNLELLFPIFNLIYWLDNLEFETILKIGKVIITEKKEEEYNESIDVILYQFISDYNNPYDFVSMKELNKRFREFYGADEYEYKWINEKWMSKALKRLVLIIEKKKTNTGSQVRLNSIKAKEKLKIFKKEEPTQILQSANLI